MRLVLQFDLFFKFQNEENNSLRYDMAELQMKLKQYEKAERTVSQALDAENNGSQRSNDMNSLMTQVLFSQYF